MRKPSLAMPDFSAVRGKHVLIALSGGADSVALTHMLAQVREPLSITLSAAHMDHGIRPDSAMDAGLCRELCGRLHIDFYQIRLDIPDLARQRGEGLETAARNVRYQWLRETRQRIGADVIALAHHMDDQAETVLMHLLRGAGPEGISGMHPLADDLYRPLLGVRKRALMDYLQIHGLSWREDETNGMDDTPRNSIRLHVIPELEKSYPQAVRAMARYARSAELESDFMARLTKAFLSKNLRQGPYGQYLYLPDDLEPAIFRRAIRAICGPNLTWERLNAVAALWDAPHGRTDISKALYAERGRSGLYILPKQRPSIAAEELALEGVTNLPNICAIHVQSAKPTPIRDDPARQVLRRAALQNAVLRTRRPGDRIRPLGCGEKLLSDYFTDRKLDRPLRDFVPLIAVENRILWVVGMGISEEARLRDDQEPSVMLECQWKFDWNK